MYQSTEHVERRLQDLMSAGLNIADPESRDRAAHYLRRIGEARLLEYTRPFREQRDLSSRFFSGTTFDQVRSLYKFDHWLRLSMLDALERIEVSIKSDVNHYLCAMYGERWFINPGFRSDFIGENDPRLPSKARDENARTVGRIEFEITRNASEEERAATTRSKLAARIVNDSEPSFVIGTITFGNLCKLYFRLRDEDANNIARTYRIRNSTMMNGILRPLNTIRNRSAHHEPLFNANLRTGVVLPEEMLPALLGPQDPPRNFRRRIYGVCLAIYYLLQDIARNTEWHLRLKTTLDSAIARTAPMNLRRAMGFPGDWDKSPIWTTKKAILLNGETL